jgi:hypothetical protein
MEFGPHVTIRGIRPELACIFPIVGEVFKHHGIDLVITSVTDRPHSKSSLHYAGAAADIYWDPAWSEILDPELIKLKLFRKINGFPKDAGIPPDYDVVFEGDHFHIEYQPKVPQEEYTRAVRKYLETAG